MSLWTKRHPIPNVYPKEFVSGLSTIFMGKIWTVLDEAEYNVRRSKRSYQVSTFVFDPELEDYTQMNCTPNVWSTKLLFLAANGTDLYMWRVRKTKHYLYKLDRATLKWEDILTVSRSSVWKSVVIIHQIMYILERDSHNTELLLITIDLTDRQFLEIQTLPMLGWLHSEFLTRHNNNLYMVGVINNIRIVFKMKNGELIEVAQEKHTGSNNYTKQAYFSNSNDCVTYVHEDQTFRTRMFDFESLKWEADLTSDWPGTPDFKSYSLVKVNGLLYTLVRIWTPNEKHFELYVLDLQPKLSSICLADLTNRLSEESDEKKIESVKQQIPIPMRGKLEELIKWRREADEVHNL